MKFLFLATAVLVGIISGIVGVVFHYLLQLAFELSYGQGHFSNSTLTLTHNLPVALTVLLPALGGLVVGLIVWLTKNNDLGGEGVPAVKRWLLSSTGPRKFSTAPLKALTSIITIGTGGSAGREGPIIAVGGALGADIGVLTKQSKENQRTLLLSGAAGAMAATFGTPAAALIFIFELFDRKPSRQVVYTVLLSILVASGVARLVFNYHGFSFPAPNTLFSLTHVIGLLIIGLCAGLLAAAFSYTLARTKIQFEKLRLFPPLKPALGGLGVGVLVTLLPYLYEPATIPLINSLLEGSSLALLLLITILGAKFVATILTVGSGGSGGIFAPSLVLGGILGACVAGTFTLLGAPLTSPGTLVLLGMAAVFAGIAHAPFAAAFLLFEMTDSLMFFPLLLAATWISYVVSKKLRPESAYYHDA